MTFLADHDVFAATVRFLRAAGHDVATAAERGLAGAMDPALLQAAAAEGRVFVTRDRHFGGLVFVQSLGTGVIYLRVLPSTLDVVHAELARVLDLYDAATLLGSFVVVEPGRHRLRRPTGDDGTPPTNGSA